MGKQQPLVPGAMLTTQDITAWYQANPWPLGSIDTVMPLDSTDEETWKTVRNSSYELNEAADPISDGSPVPVAGREGYTDVIGDMTEFGKGREMTAKDLKKFETLKRRFAETNSPTDAQQLVNHYGNDLKFVRTAMQSERIYLSWALLSNACSIDFVVANSPYMAGLSAMAYPLKTWQKDAVDTSWANTASLILDDIQSAINLAESYGKVLTKIKINTTWFTHVRNNEQVQKQCATLVQNIFETENRPTQATINQMLVVYFDQAISFEVVDERITRASRGSIKTTANPFEDGVAVFTVTTQVGRFVHTNIHIDDPTKEVYNEFYLVGNYKRVDPSYSKIYAKGQGFPVIDTYCDNFYLKIDAVAWE